MVCIYVYIHNMYTICDVYILLSSASSDANARSLHGRGSLTTAAISSSQRSSERACQQWASVLRMVATTCYVSRLIPKTKTDPLGAENS